ncbi:hypothetical protein FG87_31750 [Nocardia vulneris]|uniref:Uncharacterized protein n=1 Tax=Nocardia vulneris TaxID=1141657 RepID=A0ABR4Z864_9NOCA|nr:hypothetical protein FG87_31750 [Nocardia vulneris]
MSARAFQFLNLLLTDLDFLIAFGLAVGDSHPRRDVFLYRLGDGLLASARFGAARQDPFPGPVQALLGFGVAG